MAFAAARERCALNKHPKIHTLRHCHGTHLLEVGVNLRLIQANLGHPHVHLLVSAGGLSDDGQQWIAARNETFLVPVRALSLIFRAKVRDALKKSRLLDQVPPACWRKAWVVHAQPAGSGSKVLEYLARYVFRVAITNSRIESFETGQVTFRYRDNRTQQLHRIALPAEPWSS